MRCQAWNRESSGGRGAVSPGRDRSDGMCGTTSTAGYAALPRERATSRGRRSERGARAAGEQRTPARAAPTWPALLSAWCLTSALLLVCVAASADSGEDYYWELIGGCRTVAGTESYLKRYPRGKYTEQARRCLPRLKEEQAAWERIETCRTKEDVERFLGKYPKGAYGGRARECLERLSDVSYRIEGLLERCEVYLEQNWLFTGLDETAGMTAVECYKEVLGLDPANRRAIEGLNRVFEKYLGWAWNALRRGKVADARGYVEKLERLRPEAPEREELEDAIRAFEKHLEEGYAALEQGNPGAAREHADTLGDRYPNAPQVQELEAAIADAEEEPPPPPPPPPPPAPPPAEEEDEPERAVGESFRDCGDCPLMVVVEAGSYTMGNSWMPNERPEHTVTIAQPFAVGVYEVTFEEWDACHDDEGCSHHPGDEGWGRGKRPVINVSVEDARQYVRWLSRKTGRAYRLPSESEWEYVARAGTTTAYNWGTSFFVNASRRANCKDCGGRWAGRRTAPVGSFAKNGFGLHDVHGNVWERLEDCKQLTYHGAPQDGSVWRRGSCAFTAMRGGSWKDKGWDMRTSHRGWGTAGKRTSHAGFRVARTLGP